MSFFIVPLPHRNLIRLRGPDKASFLQGLITNDVTKISYEHPIYAAFLTPQGKFLNDLFIMETRDGDWFIDCENADDLLKRLSLFKLRSNVVLMPEDHKVYAALPPVIARSEATWQSPEVVPQWGEITTSPMAPRDDALSRHLVITDPRLPQLGQRWYTSSEPPFLLSPLETYDRHRILLGVGDGSRDIPVQKGIILEHNFDELGAIDWKKGCYMGQELIARTHYTGAIRKRLLPVKIEGPAVAHGTAIFDSQGEEVGEMRSSVSDYGLAMLRLSVFDTEPVELKACETILKPWVALNPNSG